MTRDDESRAWWAELTNEETYYVPETGHTIITTTSAPCPNPGTDDCDCPVCESARALQAVLDDSELERYRAELEARHPGRPVKVWRHPDGGLDAEID